MIRISKTTYKKLVNQTVELAQLKQVKVCELKAKISKLEIELKRISAENRKLQRKLHYNECMDESEIEEEEVKRIIEEEENHFVQKEGQEELDASVRI